MSSTTKQQTTTKQHTYTYRPALKAYLDAFDGTPKKFSDVEHLFDKVYHRNFTFSTEDGKIHTRKEAKASVARKLALGSQVEIIHWKRIGMSCTDLKYRLVNKEEDTITRVLFNTVSKKIIRAYIHDDTFSSTLKAKTKSDFYFYWGALLSTEHLGSQPENCAVEYKNKNLRRWSKVEYGDDVAKKGLYHNGLYVYPFVTPSNLERQNSDMTEIVV